MLAVVVIVQAAPTAGTMGATPPPPAVEAATGSGKSDGGPLVVASPRYEDGVVWQDSSLPWALRMKALFQFRYLGVKAEGRPPLDESSATLRRARV